MLDLSGQVFVNGLSVVGVAVQQQPKKEVNTKKKKLVEDPTDPLNLHEEEEHEDKAEVVVSKHVFPVQETSYSKKLQQVVAVDDFRSILHALFHTKLASANHQDNLDVLLKKVRPEEVHYRFFDKYTQTLKCLAEQHNP